MHKHGFLKFSASRRASPEGEAPASPRFARDESGSVAIEFAFIATVFLAILFGIMSYGFQFATRIALSYAVTEGGRAAVAGLDPDQRELYATEAINEALNAYSPLIDPSLAQLSFLETSSATGNRLEISIDYDDTRFSFFPFIPAPGDMPPVTTTYIVTDPSG